ncbi:MAG: MCE family protein [Chloroflexi bacterium]|nr:MAG: MCE family protein [Chloroflexota bacterium]
MHRPRVNPLVSGAITSIVLLVVMSVILIGGIPAGPQIPLPWNQTMTLRVQLADADALAPHASVEIGGIKIGEVRSVEAQGNLAVATLQLQQQYSDIRRNSVVYLRAHGLFGPKYIAIVPGTVGSATLHDGDTILAAQTVQPVDLNAILQDLQTPEQQSLRTFIVQFGEAAAGQGDNVNHLLGAANTLSRVLDAPLKTVGSVAPQLSNMLVNDEAFNNYFSQAPLDQLVANQEQTFQAFAANADHIQSLLVHANSALSSLDTALHGQPGNLAAAIQTLGQPGGTIDKLNKFTYLISLFGANFTGKEVALGSDPADLNVTNDIIGALTNVASSLYYSDTCPAPTAGNDNHCSVSPDGRQHYLHVRPINWPPQTAPNCPHPVGLTCPPAAFVARGNGYYPDQLAFGMEALLAS